MSMDFLGTLAGETLVVLNLLVLCWQCKRNQAYKKKLKERKELLHSRKIFTEKRILIGEMIFEALLLFVVRKKIPGLYVVKNERNGSFGYSVFIRDVSGFNSDTYSHHPGTIVVVIHVTLSLQVQESSKKQITVIFNSQLLPVSDVAYIEFDGHSLEVERLIEFVSSNIDRCRV